MFGIIPDRISPRKDCVPVIHFVQAMERPRELGNRSRSTVLLFHTAELRRQPVPDEPSRVTQDSL